MFDRSDNEKLFEHLANDLTHKLRAVYVDAEDEMKLERATAIVSDASAPVIALVSLALFASLDEFEQRIVALEHRLASVGKVTRGTLEN